MISLKKLCSGTLAALLLMAGCSQNDKGWVYRSGDIQPAAGIYISYLIDGASNAMGKLDEAGVENAVSMSLKEILEQTVEDQPASQWIIADAQNSLREYIAVEQQYAAEGVVIEESTLNAAKSSAAESWASYGEMYEENGVAESSVEQQMIHRLKRNALFNHYYAEGGKTPVSEDELKARLKEDYTKVGYMYLMKATEDKTGEDGAVAETKDELNAALKKTAEDYAKRLNDGEALEDVIFEHEKSEAGDQADEVVKPEPDTRVLILSESMAGTYYSEELVTGGMAISEGKAAVVEDDTFFYILQRTDILENPDDFTSLRGSILSNMKGDEFDAMVSDWANSLDIETNQAALDYYTPSRLKLD